MARAELLSLLRTARESPDDPTPKLVVADWLEEHGDETDRARAEYVRLHGVPPDQRTHAMRERAGVLCQKYIEAWLGRLETLGAVCHASGGFPEVELSSRVLLGKAVAALAGTEEWAWVGHLRVGVSEAAAAAVAASPLLAHAGTLTVRGLPAAPAQVFASPHLRAVRHLDLQHTQLTDDGLRHLTASPHLGNLVELNLADNPLTDAGLTEFTRAASLGALRRLVLRKARVGSVRIGPAGIDALFGLEALPSLADLDLSENHLGNRAAVCLARGPLAEQLETLRLSCCRLTARGAAALADSGRFGRLRSLSVSRNALGPDGVAALAASGLLGRSQELDLRYCRVGDLGLRRLAASAGAAGWTALRVGWNGITEVGARVIADGPWSGVRDLFLFHDPIGDDGAAALASSPVLAELRSLTLYDCHLTRVGALALARSPFLRHIEHLSLTCNGSLGDEVAAAVLKERFGDRVSVRGEL